MKQYLDLVQHVLTNGTRKENRTGVDTISTFNYNYEVDLRDGFPLLTTKEISWKNIVIEMLWFLSGQTDISILERHGCKFWSAWADPVTKRVPSAYGTFWRRFPVHSEKVHDEDEVLTLAEMEALSENGTTIEPAFNDQIRWVLDELKRNPMSRRLVVSAWAPGNAQTSKLPPCHSIFMLNVQNEELNEYYYYGNKHRGALGKLLATSEPEALKIAKTYHTKPDDVTYVGLSGERFANPRLNLHLTQRSADVALGVPYNIASYSLLIHLFSRFTGIEPGIFAHTCVDPHIYTKKADGTMEEYDHIPGLTQQLFREPRPLPRLVIDPAIKTLEDVEALMDPKLTTDEIMKYFVLEGYDPHPAIKFKVAV